MPASVRSTSVVVIGLLGLLAGCGGLDQANAAGVTQGDLVSEVASQLATPGPEHTATYRLAGGDTARVTRSLTPDRTAYAFPDGRLIRTPAAVTRCAGDVCTASDPDPAAALPAGTGLVTDAEVVALLEAAAVDAYPEVTQTDTTLAGRHATCLALTGVQAAEASSFDVCVTVGGMLASFRGRFDGTEVDVVLTEYADEADERDFQVPPGSELVDRRDK
ncbi:hypothetical protein ACQP2E_03610 [Actinoplanes sp. CA-015351]|uniref:hypothetical protein n=1 Tax=Actinoplanes sp. CA-015351 TaxID=3239897 RepID=UPI003D95FBA2